VDLTWQDSRLKYSALRPRLTAALCIRALQELRIAATKNNELPCEVHARTDRSIRINALAGHRYELYAD
jgi:hypothetical protein